RSGTGAGRRVGGPLAPPPAPHARLGAGARGARPPDRLAGGWDALASPRATCDTASNAPWRAPRRPPGGRARIFKEFRTPHPFRGAGATIAFDDMPPSAPRLRQDLVLWMLALRRSTVLAGLAVAIVEKLVLPDELALAPVLVVALAVCIYNALGGRLLRFDRPARVTAVVNAQVALDTVSLVLLLHFGGGLNSLGVLFFAPAFFAYGAVLPLPLAFVHVALATLELALLGVGELGGIVAHFGSGGFYRPEAYGEWGFVALVVMAVTTVDALCAYLSHYLSGLLGVQEARSRALAAARPALLARHGGGAPARGRGGPVRRRPEPCARLRTRDAALQPRLRGAHGVPRLLRGGALRRLRGGGRRGAGGAGAGHRAPGGSRPRQRAHPGAAA